MVITINVLGPLEIRIDDRPAPKMPRKAGALLAFLAMKRGRTATRSDLADLLWPYQTPEQSRHSLRNCLVELRKALGPAAVHLIGGFSSCGVDDYFVTDFDRFDQLAKLNTIEGLKGAAELYRGEVLRGVDFASEPFQQWLTNERDEALLRVREVLRKLSHQSAAEGRFDDAISAARRMVVLDDMCEIGHQTLIRAHQLAGRRGDAMRAYRACAAVLKRELQVEPDVATQRLVGMKADTATEQLVATLPQPAKPLQPTKPAPTSEIVAEIRRLRKSLNSALAGERPFTRQLMEKVEDALAKADASLSAEHGADHPAASIPLVPVPALKSISCAAYNPLL